MTTLGRMRFAAALCAAFGLQGCVALAAVPILASGAMVGRTAVFGERTRQALVEGTDIDPGDLEAVPLDTQYVLLDTTTLPEPAQPAPQSASYTAFHDYAAARFAEGDWSRSAILADPGKLRPLRAPCEEHRPAVLVDLDPQAGLVPLSPTARPAARFVGLLGDLRRRGITVAWMTDREPSDARAVRARLRDTGLDPTGRDPLFVQRYPGEKKQARRQALGETHCLLAIAGDERADFDDLYLYLLDQSSAAPLEAMLGEGWFLMPAPLQ
ncbi:HAD family hydrolase [Aurantiacibacter spongiae]|uniref:Acid phosphatase n=1 Tax=Aurantiacibacter spongiae TaxID=2488860 RepID=A0A3N5DHU0_9SPHN|nr:hypothetical protein [Aurantiacibacter spongiae]RPF71232.1 hypothetical protein EG799_06135 [Aurantiacibacter spongiae]